MTGVFFLLSILYGWIAYNLYRPIYASAPANIVSFAAGWLGGELAIHHIAWQLALTLVFVMADAVTGIFGALALLICIVSWAAMAFQYFKSDRAADEIESALQLGLEANYGSLIRPEFVRAFPTEIDISALVRPFKIIDPQVELIKNITYGTSGQKLDIYRSRESVSDAPVLLQIHGGGWTEKLGDKNHQALPLMNHMALRGWISVSIDYRLSPSATFPDHIIDCKEGLVWIKQHIAEYGGNPSFIVVTGGSAGGQLSSLVALSPNDQKFQPGFEDEDTSVQGAVPFYGIYDFTDSNGFQPNNVLSKFLEESVIKASKSDAPELYEAISPLFRINEAAPPFLIIHGDSDTLLPVLEARFFADRLRETSKQAVVYAEIGGAQHAFDMFPSLRSEHVKHGVERFLCLLYSQYLDQREANSTPDETTVPIRAVGGDVQA